MTSPHEYSTLNSAFQSRASLRTTPVPMAVFVLVLLCAALGARAATSATGSNYDLSWHTIDGGGGTSAGGGYEISGTIGQPDAGVMSGGGFKLAGGFWTGAAETTCAPADLNCDGVVDGADLLILLSSWGKCNDCNDCLGNLNDDCTIDGADLLILLSNWG